MEKECRKCGAVKLLDLFPKGKGYRDGTKNICKECLKAYDSERFRLNKDKTAKRRAEYQRLYWIENRARLIQNQREHYYANRDKMIQKQKEYNEKNKEKRRAYYREYKRAQWRENKQMRMADLLRNRIRHALSDQRTVKTLRTQELLGCTIEDAIKHIESQFTEGMSWETRGEWHIDHIKPCAAFDLTDIDQQRECFNWKNLQPLWAAENIAKGNRLRRGDTNGTTN